MSKQRSTPLPKTATMSNEFIVKLRPFDKVETNWTCSICFDVVERTKCRTFDIVEATFDFVGRMVRLVAFDDVASTSLLVWTRLNRVALPWNSLNHTLEKSSYCAFNLNAQSKDFSSLRSFKRLLNSHDLYLSFSPFYAAVLVCFMFSSFLSGMM